MIFPRKPTTWLGVVLLVGSGVAAAFSQQNGIEKDPAYVTVPDCRLEFVEQAQLAGERAGILQNVTREGALIASGEIVAQLRDTPLRAGLAIAQQEATNDIEIRFAKKAAELAHLKYERAIRANHALEGTVSSLELSELQLAAQKAALQLEQAEHQFAIAGLRRDEMTTTLATLKISAPFNAFVRTVHKKPGEFVHEGEVIAEVVHTGRVLVEGHLDIDDLPRVRQGQRVEVRLTGSHLENHVQSLRFHGHVGFVDVKVEPVSQRVRIWAEVVNEPAILREGLTATMYIDGLSSGSSQRP